MATDQEHEHPTLTDLANCPQMEDHFREWSRIYYERLNQFYSSLDLAIKHVEETQDAE